MGYRLYVRGSGGREVTGPEPVWNGLLCQSRLAKMTCNELRLRFDQLWKPSFDRCGDPPVQFLAAALEQALLGRVLDQRMLEAIMGLRRSALDKQKIGVGEPVQ